MRIPKPYLKILNIIRDVDTDRRTTIESEIVRRFRLSKEDTDLILKDFESEGMIERTRFKIITEKSINI